jgi:hypothetical protein
MLYTVDNRSKFNFFTCSRYLLSSSELYAIRRSPHAGRPLGAAEFTRALEQRTQRRLMPRPRNRPRKTPGAENPPRATAQNLTQRE